MKITTEKLMVWAKRAVLALALAATAGVMLPSCEKEIQQHDEVIWFYSNNNHNPQWRTDTLSKYAKDKCVRNIYITIATGETFKHYSKDVISAVRYDLQNAMNMSSKFKGCGDFDFTPGRCTYGDSMDFVAMGFTINQQNR